MYTVLASKIYYIVANLAKTSLKSGELHPFFNEKDEGENYTMHTCFNNLYTPFCCYLKDLPYEMPNKNDLNLELSFGEWFIEQYSIWRLNKKRLKMIEDELNKIGGTNESKSI